MARLADIVFTLDTTGSMDFAIEGLKDVISQLADIYLEERIDTRLGLIQFRDRITFGESEDGYNTLRREIFDGEEFTSNAKQFSDVLQFYVAYGGGPDEESSLDALALAADSYWREDAHRIIIHITDAPPQIPDVNIQSIDSLIHVLSEAEIDQLHFIVREEDMDHYADLAETTSDGVDGDNLATVTWTAITDDYEDTKDKLKKIAKTSSGSIVSKGDVVFRRSEDKINSFDEAEPTGEDEVDEVDEANPFADLD